MISDFDKMYNWILEFTNFLSYKFELVYQYMILNLVIFFKTIAISHLRYKRLKNFSKKVLDVFVLKK